MDPVIASDDEDMDVAISRRRVKLKRKTSGVCHVCGRGGHSAGFIGSVYMDCPFKPCYLCKQSGHTTAECPYRIRPGQAQAGSVARTQAGGAATSTRSHLQGLLSRAPAPFACMAGRPVLAALHPASSSSPFGRDTWGWALRGQGMGSGVPTHWRVQSAVLRLHARRVSCLLFPSSSPTLLVSGDKSGELGVWSWGGDARDRAVYGAHRYLINGIAEDGRLSTPSSLRLWTVSADGTVRLQDVHRRAWQEVLDLNPAGWDGNEAAWRMFYSLAVPPPESACPVLAGDDSGRVWAVDARAPSPIGWVQAHGKGDKVTSLSINPVEAHLVASAGNDWCVRLWDVRAASWAGLSAGNARAGADSNTHPHAPHNTTLGEGEGEGEGEDGAVGCETAIPCAPTSALPGKGVRGKGVGAGGGDKAPRKARGSTTSSSPAQPLSGTVPCLAVLRHPRVVTAATFSPHTGRQLLSTCIDNRVRVWEDVLGGACAGRAPTRELPHSHDFARYLSPFKAVWYSPDPTERTAVCGRYISESFTGRSGASLALHPVDILDVSGGGMVPTGPSMGEGMTYAPSPLSGPLRVIAQLADPIQDKIAPVNAVHPHIGAHVVASAASTCVYLWRPLGRAERDWRKGDEGGRTGWGDEGGRTGWGEEDDADESEDGRPGRGDGRVCRPSSPPPAPVHGTPSPKKGATKRGKGAVGAGAHAAFVPQGWERETQAQGDAGVAHFDPLSLLHAWQSGVTLSDGPGLHHGRADGAAPYAPDEDEGEGEGGAKKKAKKQ